MAHAPPVWKLTLLVKWESGTKEKRLVVDLVYLASGRQPVLRDLGK